MFSVEELQKSESVFIYYIIYITVILILVQTESEKLAAQTKAGQGMLVKLMYVWRLLEPPQKHNFDKSPETSIWQVSQVQQASHLCTWTCSDASQLHCRLRWFCFWVWEVNAFPTGIGITIPSLSPYAFWFSCLCVCSPDTRLYRGVIGIQLPRVWGQGGEWHSFWNSLKSSPTLIQSQLRA